MKLAGRLGDTLHPATGPECTYDEWHRHDCDGGTEREEELVENVGDGKCGGALAQRR